MTFTNLALLSMHPFSASVEMCTTPTRALPCLANKWPITLVRPLVSKINSSPF